MIADKDTLDGLKDIDQILAEIKLARTHGAELFYIDPLNYLIKQVSKTQQEMNMNESNFTKNLKRFLEKTETTALLVLHNAKDPNLHRAMGLAGSADYPRLATKVIETRVENKYNLADGMLGSGERGAILSIELWSARGIEQHAFRPYCVKAVFNPGHKGVRLAEVSINDMKNKHLCSLLDGDAPDHKSRKLWWMQDELWRNNAAE